MLNRFIFVLSWILGFWAGSRYRLHHIEQEYIYVCKTLLIFFFKNNYQGWDCPILLFLSSSSSSIGFDYTGHYINPHVESVSCVSVESQVFLSTRGDPVVWQSLCSVAYSLFNPCSLWEDWGNNIHGENAAAQVSNVAHGPPFLYRF